MRADAAISEFETDVLFGCHGSQSAVKAFSDAPDELARVAEL
jgi:hypothetical protein